MATGACHTEISRRCRSPSSEPSWCPCKPVNGGFQTALITGPIDFSVALFFDYHFCLGIVGSTVYVTIPRTALPQER